MKTTKTVLAKVNEDQKAIERVESKLFTVVKLRMKSPKTGFRAPQDVFGIWKDTGGDCLGFVGSRTTPTQPKFLFNTILNTSYTSPDVFDLSSLNFVERNNGSRIEFQVNLESFTVPTKLKGGDVTELKLLFSTSYNNDQSNRIDLYTERLVCKNGMVRRFKTATFNVRNTKNSEKTIEKYFYDIAKIIEEVDEYKEDMLKLAATKIKDADVERLICKVFKFDVDADKRKALQVKKHEELMKAVDLEIGRTGKTAFGLLQGITYFINHVAGADKNADYMITGNGAATAQQAQKAVMQLV